MSKINSQNRNFPLRASVQYESPSLSNFVRSQVKIDDRRFGGIMIILSYKNVISILVYFNVNIQLTLWKRNTFICYS